MPNIHSWGEPIEELGGTIQGGTSVIMHSLSELADMARLCALAGNSSEPMHALYGLVNSREPIDVPVDTRFHWLEPESGDFEHMGRALGLAFSYIWDLWKAAPGTAELTCCLSIARPEHDMRLDIDVAQPGVVIHYGSLLATLVSGPLSVFVWSIGLFSSRGMAGSTRARRIMEDVRTKALNQSGTQPLERLDNLPPDYLRGKSAVIVLIHGLLSTDAGFFDPLLQQLRGDGLRDRRVAAQYAGGYRRKCSRITSSVFARGWNPRSRYSLHLSLTGRAGCARGRGRTVRGECDMAPESEGLRDVRHAARGLVTRGSTWGPDGEGGGCTVVP
jgi:hypothetical protein